MGAHNSEFFRTLSKKIWETEQTLNYVSDLYQAAGTKDPLIIFPSALPGIETCVGDLHFASTIDVVHRSILLGYYDE